MQIRATLGVVRLVVASSILSGFPMAVAIENRAAFLKKWIGKPSRLTHIGKIEGSAAR